jgi:dihydrodipicolinate synthase/N-acetylneuraminate lyase
MKLALKEAGAKAVIIAPHLGTIVSQEGLEIHVDLIKVILLPLRYYSMPYLFRLEKEF